MRGTFGTDFDLDTIYRVALSLPKAVAGGRWLIGRDARTTSPQVRDALLAGLVEAGVKVQTLAFAQRRWFISLRHKTAMMALSW